MKKFLLPALVGLVTPHIWAQQTKLLTAEKHNEYGLVYSLPITAFQVEVVAVKESKVAGPFANYAGIFTSDKTVIDKDEVTWTVEDVKVIPYGVADPDNRYLMQLKAGSPTFMQIADDGMLLAINKEVKTPTFGTTQIVAIEGTPVSGKEYLEFANEDFLSAKSSFKKAQILAEEIMEVRESKLSLTRGTAETMPTDGKQLELMLGSLEKQEKALTNAFIGASWKERVVKTYSIVPQKEGKFVVCRLNRSEGLVDATDYSGEPVYVMITLKEEADLPVDAKGEEKKVPKDAVIYSLPGVANVSITLSGISLFQRDFPMSQFGTTFGLNPSIFTDKKEPSYAVFDPTTGALIELGTIK